MGHSLPCFFHQVPVFQSPWLTSRANIQAGGLTVWVQQGWQDPATGVRASVQDPSLWGWWDLWFPERSSGGCERAEGRSLVRPWRKSWAPAKQSGTLRRVQVPEGCYWAEWLSRTPGWQLKEARPKGRTHQEWRDSGGSPRCAQGKELKCTFPECPLGGRHFPLLVLRACPYSQALPDAQVLRNAQRAG